MSKTTVLAASTTSLHLSRTHSAMPDGGATLGLTSSKPSSSSSSSSSYSHGARAKTPLRARKILRTMDAGFERSRRKAEEEAQKEGKGKERASDCGEKETEQQRNIVEPAKEEANTVSTAPPLKRRPSSRPRQAYLAKLAAQQKDGEHDANGAEPSRDAHDVSAKASTSSTMRPPPVSLFSSRSKDQLTALTSKTALADSRNPITHSTTGHGTMHYNSSSTGHQVANRVGVATPSGAPEGWWATRTRKLRHQLLTDHAKQSDLFRGCKVYINGYTGESVGNKDLMRLITLHGGEVHFLPHGGTTHVISEMQLSAKKREEMLQLKAGRVKRFVRVEWVLDSIEAGKRKPEHLYSHGTETQRGIGEMMGGVTKPVKGMTPFVASAGQQAKLASSGAAATTVTPSSGLSAATGDWRKLGRKQAASIAKAPSRGCSG